MRSEGMTFTKMAGDAAPRAVMRDLAVTLHLAPDALADEWHRLDSDSLNSLHQSRAWCEAWLKTQNANAALLHGQENGRTVFILPLEIVRSGLFRVARFMGGSHNNINTGLFDATWAAHHGAGQGEALAAAIRQTLAGHADIVALRNVPLEWRGRTSPLAALSRVENQNRAFQLPVLESFEATLAQVNAKRRRKKFRVQTRRLAETGGYSHIIATTHEERHALLERFFIQKKERFQRLGMPDVFSDAAIRSFFHMLTDTPPAGEDRMLELNALCLHGEYEGAIAAIAGLSRKGDHVICQFGSIDESVLPEASPGELLFWLMIEKACKEGAALFDFGVGDQLYKRSWCPVETVQHDIFIPVNARGIAAQWLLTGAVRAKAAIKSNRTLYSWMQKLRAIRSKGEERPTQDTGQDS